ncbi:MAG: HAMP domain-containing sensor histidine kinase [Chloroflexota bacterium]
MADRAPIRGAPIRGAPIQGARRSRVSAALGGMSIRWRLTATYVALVGAIVLALSIVLYGQLERFVVDDATRRITAEVTRLASQDVPAPKPGKPAEKDLAKFGRDLVRALAGRDHNVAVVDATGSLVAASELLPDGPAWPTPSSSELAAATTDHEGPMVVAVANIRLDADGRPRLLLVIEPVRDGAGTVVAAAAVATSLESADSTLDQLRLFLLLGLLVSVALGIGLGLPITRVLLRPLERVVRTADRIAAGDRALRVGAHDDRTETGRLAVAFDRMVDQLEAGVSAQRRFVADASHELRSPLAALRGMVEVLLLGIDEGDPAAVQRVLAAMHREIDRLARLAADLLLLSQFEDGDQRVPLISTEFGAGEVAREVVEELGAGLAERRVSIEAPAEVRIAGDRDRVKQVLLNLVENAARHTDPGGAILIAAAPDGEFIRVTVRDDGDGLPAEALTRVFDRFYRADGARARDTNGGRAAPDTAPGTTPDTAPGTTPDAAPGTNAGPAMNAGPATPGGAGLGLAIVRAIVEAHGGRVTADSPGPGGGAIFSAWLPRASAGSGASVPPSSANLQESTVGPSDTGPTV